MRENTESIITLAGSSISLVGLARSGHFHRNNQKGYKTLFLPSVQAGELFLLRFIQLQIVEQRGNWTRDWNWINKVLLFRLLRDRTGLSSVISRTAINLLLRRESQLLLTVFFIIHIILFLSRLQYVMLLLNSDAVSIISNMNNLSERDTTSYKMILNRNTAAPPALSSSTFSV